MLKVEKEREEQLQKQEEEVCKCVAMHLGTWRVGEGQKGSPTAFHYVLIL